MLVFIAIGVAISALGFLVVIVYAASMSDDKNKGKK